MYRNCKSCCMCNQCSCNKKNDSDNIIENTCSCIENNMMDMKDSCECGFDEEDKFFPTNPMFAQSYVPWQTMDKTFMPCVGLKMGTIFPELVSPYMPGQSMEEIDYIKNTNNIGEECANR